MATYQQVRLSELIHQNAVPEKIADTKNERYVTVSLYGKGVKERVIKDDKYPVPFVGYRVSEGQFIYSRIDARNGAYGIIGPELDGFVVSKDFPVYDIDTSKILPQFLLISVLSESFLHQVKNSSFGATNRMRIKEEILEGYSIFLPPLEEQARLATLIGATQSLLELRQRQLHALDALIKARFVEMFGDMLINPMNWPEQRLETVAEIVSGITKGRKIQTIELFEVPYMAVSNVKDGYIDWTTVKTIAASQAEIDQYRLMPDDVLMTEGGDPDKLGRGAIIHNPPKDCIHQNHIFRVRLNQEHIRPEFMEQYLQHQRAKRYFLGCAKQTTGIASINMTQLRALPMLMPPMGLQNQFATFVSQVDKSKAAVQAALDKAQLLFNSLMQQYFG